MNVLIGGVNTHLFLLCMEVAMIDNMKNQCLTYYYQVMSWYDGMTFAEQFLILFFVFAVLATAISLFIVKKATS